MRLSMICRDAWKPKCEVLSAETHFDLAEAAFALRYVLPCNMLKMEQRIDRCQRR